MVFQSYALFPHMTVAENVAFGLEMRKVPQAEIGRRASPRRCASSGSSGFDGRYPRQLSGGQQQRVALARALAMRPDVLLLDEPLSNLDAKLRQEVRVEIRELQRKLGLTTIMVTHDQEEALTMADRLVVMEKGRVRQIGIAARSLRAAGRSLRCRLRRPQRLPRWPEPGARTLRQQGRARHRLCGCQGRRWRDTGAEAGADRRWRRGGRAGKPVRGAGRIYVSYLGRADRDACAALAEQDRMLLQLPNRQGVAEPRPGETITIGWAEDAGLVYALES